jgi:hypothetical protein
MIHSLFFILFFHFLSPEPLQLNQQVVFALKTGNATELGKSLDTKVDLGINGKESSVDKSKAVAQLKDFFEKNKPYNFQLIHSGTSPTGLEYYIGSLSCETQSFRVSIYMKKQGAQSVITQLIFES